MRLLLYADFVKLFRSIHKFVGKKKTLCLCFNSKCRVVFIKNQLDYQEEFYCVLFSRVLHFSREKLSFVIKYEIEIYEYQISPGN